MSFTTECQSCGSNFRVRQCCTWKGNTWRCPTCFMRGKGRTENHVCGIGIQEPLKIPEGEMGDE